MTIHDFDMARFLAGSEVTEVYANATCLVDPAIGAAGDVDTAVISLKFANGAVGVIDNSRRAAYGYDQRVEVFGSKGAAVASNDTPTNVVFMGDEGVVPTSPCISSLRDICSLSEMRCSNSWKRCSRIKPPPPPVRTALTPSLLRLRRRNQSQRADPFSSPR